MSYWNSPQTSALYCNIQVLFFEEISRNVNGPNRHICWQDWDACV